MSHELVNLEKQLSRYLSRNPLKLNIFAFKIKPNDLYSRKLHGIVKLWFREEKFYYSCNMTYSVLLLEKIIFNSMVVGEFIARLDSGQIR